MKIHIELKKKRYILYAAIIALLGVVGANISILHTNADKITKHIEYKSFLTQLIAVFRVSITNKEGNGTFLSANGSRTIYSVFDCIFL